LVENIFHAYNAVLHVLPKEKDNMKSTFIKLTMSPSVEITDKGPVLHHQKDKKEAKK